MAATTEAKVRQLAWVYDLNKCIGCQTCSVACKVLWTREESEKQQWWCSVNTMPGLGTPKAWEQMGGGIDLVTAKPRPGHQPTREEFGGGFDFNYDEVFYGGTGGKAHLEPQAPRENRWAMNWDEDQGAGEWPNSYYFYLPRMCNHCTNPVCVGACASGALSKTDNGLVLRDEENCMGDRFCMEACPYKKIYFNYERHVAQQCIGCFPRIEAGVAPACVRQCPGRAVFARKPTEPFNERRSRCGAGRAAIRQPVGRRRPPLLLRRRHGGDSADSFQDPWAQGHRPVV